MEIKTPVGLLMLPDSVHNKSKCTKTMTRALRTTAGRQGRLDVTIRWDDALGNGHNTFAVTGELYERDSLGILRWSAGGCLHDEIAEGFPELAHAISYHLFSADGPMHYFANATFLAGDVDCWGSRKGEQRRSGKSNLPVWQLPVSPYTVVHAEQAPPDYVVEYEPVLSAGKARDFEAARSCVKHLALTDQQLALPRAELKALLLQQDAALSDTTAENVAYLASDRDFSGQRSGEQQVTKEGLVWRLRASPFTYAYGAEKPPAFVTQYTPVLGEGKQRELEHARSAACWPDVDDATLMLPKADLEKLLAARLPALMASFKTVVEGLGFVY